MPAEPTLAEKQANAGAVRAILVRRCDALEQIEPRTEEQEADLQRLGEAINKIDAAWQPTAQA
jgi:hypothetical protein